MTGCVTRHPLAALQPEALSGTDLTRVRSQLSYKRGLRFYQSRRWVLLRADVLARDHNECQLCKERGMYSRANMVHHVHALRSHPELALAMHYIDLHGKSRRQLVSLCKECHENIPDSQTEVTEQRFPEKW